MKVKSIALRGFRGFNKTDEIEFDERLSIAINLKKESPFEFLIIDDPIQSWDAEHELQFIAVIRELVARGKQLVLLSHNRAWLNTVRVQCADLNGLFYEITSYTDSGPHISKMQWADVKQRLLTIKGIAENPNANSVQLQIAEEEFRHVLNLLTAELVLKVKGTKLSTSNLNADLTKKNLLSCGVKPEFVNKIMSVFETVDDSHHTPVDYAVNRERVRQYSEWLHSLQELIKKTPKPTA